MWLLIGLQEEVATYDISALSADICTHIFSANDLASAETVVTCEMNEDYGGLLTLQDGEKYCSFHYLID